MDITEEFTKFLVNLLIIVFAIIMVYNIFPSLALIPDNGDHRSDKITEGADGSITHEQCQNKITSNSNSLAITQLKKEMQQLQTNVKANTGQINALNKQVHKNNVDNGKKNNEAAKSASKGIPSK